MRFLPYLKRRRIKIWNKNNCLHSKTSSKHIWKAENNAVYWDKTCYKQRYLEPFMCLDPMYKLLEKRLICDTFLFKVLNKSNIQVPSKLMSRNSPQKLWPMPSSNSNNWTLCSTLPIKQCFSSPMCVHSRTKQPWHATQCYNYALGSWEGGCVCVCVCVWVCVCA